MSKIGWGQLGIVLALSRIFSEAANFPSDDINYGMHRFTVIILSYAILVAVLIPVFLIARQNDGTAAVRNKFTAVIVIIYLIMAAISTTTRLQFYASSTIFDAAPPWVLILFVSLVCFYGLFKGLPAVVRSGVIISALFLGLLITVIIGVSDDIELKYLYPALSDRPSSLMGDIITELSKNGELALFAALYGNVREKAHRSLLVYFPLALITQLFMTFLYNTVLGEYLNVTSFPFYMLSSLSDISLLQRLDGIDVAVWVMSAVIKISLLALSVFSVCRNAGFKKKTAYIISAAALTVSSLASLFFSVNTSDFLIFAGIIETALPLLAAGFAVPLSAVVCDAVRNRKERKPHAAH